MRIALIGDLHGNLPALEAVARDIERRRADAIYCLGDMTGKGPNSPETLDWALAHCAVVLMGNWDETVAGLVPTSSSSMAWFRNQLGEKRLAALAALPKEHFFQLAGRRVRLLHGRSVTPNVVYSDSPKAWRQELFEVENGLRPQIVGFADVHRPFYEQISGCGTLFNTGSVGNPLAQQPYPSYVLLEGPAGEAEGPLLHTIVQLPYDREEAVRQALAAEGLPRQEAFVREVRTGLYSR